MIEAIRTDITTLKVDAIVNAANRSMLGGGGVDGAIHRAAGEELLKACKLLGKCETGEAKITRGYDLPAKFIIHTVGPVWQGGGDGEARALQCCYENALLLAKMHDLTSIAFPCISTGVYRFPKEQAATIAVGTVKDFLDNNETMLQRILFVCFSKNDLKIYEALLKNDERKNDE